MVKYNAGHMAYPDEVSEVRQGRAEVGLGEITLGAQGRAGQGRAGQGRAGQGRAGQGRAGRGSIRWGRKEHIELGKTSHG